VHFRIVVIPGIGLAKPSAWIDSSESKSTRPWLGRIIEDDAVPQAEIWEWVYSTELQESIADTVSREGSALFEALDGQGCQQNATDSDQNQSWQ
jgi:hypothetical protein